MNRIPSFIPIAYCQVVSLQLGHHSFQPPTTHLYYLQQHAMSLQLGHHSLQPLTTHPPRTLSPVADIHSNPSPPTCTISSGRQHPSSWGHTLGRMTMLSKGRWHQLLSATLKQHLLLLLSAYVLLGAEGAKHVSVSSDGQRGGAILRQC